MKLRFWYTVWGDYPPVPSLEELIAELRPKEPELSPQDDGNTEWKKAEFRIPQNDNPVLMISRYQIGEIDFDSQIKDLIEWIGTLDDEPEIENLQEQLRTVKQRINIKPILGFGS